ncbi:hypothetical protein D5085_18155 [Ectothiorhodospiraceae bacterium BW-2]|nr:hypothetical protein D5085_18155 [Ectothiorhodospiraceae bacterium BW-2]
MNTMPAIVLAALMSDANLAEVDVAVISCPSLEQAACALPDGKVYSYQRWTETMARSPVEVLHVSHNQGGLDQIWYIKRPALTAAVTLDQTEE